MKNWSSGNHRIGGSNWFGHDSLGESRSQSYQLKEIFGHDVYSPGEKEEIGIQKRAEQTTQEGKIQEATHSNVS